MRALLVEVVERDGDGFTVLTGAFEVRLDGGRGPTAVLPSLEAALEWARGRASGVDVEVEGVRSSMDARSPSGAGDAQLARAASGRRRLPGEEWLDRTPHDAPIAWAVEVELHPPDPRGPGPARAAQERVAAAVAAALAAAGYADAEVSTASLDAAMADIHRQTPGGVGGWTTAHRLAYLVTAGVDGPSRSVVVERAVATAAGALDRVTGGQAWRHRTLRPRHLGWGVVADARPADAAHPGVRGGG